MVNGLLNGARRLFRRGPRLGFTVLLGPVLGGAVGAQPPDAPGTIPDVRLMVVDYFEHRLPTGWWIADPIVDGGGYRVDLHIPPDWKGNPVGVVRRYCPEPSDPIFARISHLTITPFYDHHRWAWTNCNE